MGWEIVENSRDSESLQLAKDSFRSLFEDRFGMSVDSGPADAATAQAATAHDVVLCDDLSFEALRAEGSVGQISQGRSAILVFCSSIRYAAAMASHFPDMSFLTPPPGPTQLSRWV